MSRGNRVYVGNLDNRTREREIDDAFRRYGRIRAVDLKQGGFAFVEFDDPRDAEDAVYDMDGRNLDGARVRVEFSKGGRRGFNAGGGFGGGGGGGGGRGGPNHTDYALLVEGIPRDMSWQDLKDLFRRVGDVVFTDVGQDRDGKNVGHVEMRSRDDMDRAIRELDNSELRSGDKIYVSQVRSRRALPQQ
eukprot:TRINITY_DN176_c0_g1_i1.p1 TRINITY_DN176_c0_g1~~TRINITY_DN176_c0_g1_i1.p1  ORF type:complete len:189 (-),score=46.00 TRINITY_DN176_c0_g1_i1:663-1229(-)